MTDAERANNGADLNLDWDSGLDFVEFLISMNGE